MADDGVVGVDLGGTKIAAAFVAADGQRLRASVRHPHGNGGPEAVVAEMVEILRQVSRESGQAIRRVGLGVAAQVDVRTGMVHHAPNLRWRDVPLGAMLSRSMDVPVSVVNDARAATIAEWQFGAGRGVDDLLVVSLGTGVGGSVVLGGSLPEGADGAIGEIGHTILVAGGRKCTCPGRGCLEAYASGWAIAERAREAVASDPAGGRRLVELSGGPDKVSAGPVGVLARLGDPLSSELFRQTLSYLGTGLAGVVNGFNPRRVIVVGGLATGWPEVVGAIQETIRSHCQTPASGATVHAGRLGEDAVLVGAANWARDRAADRAGARY
ncbi:MAG: ROK family protein [Thermoplasmata archaeon]|nr:ROK family protein [Thermoplasmata archaeon]